MLIGEGLYFKSGISKKSPKEYKYYTNQIIEYSKMIGNTTFRNLPFDFDPPTSAIIQLMDVVCNLNHIIDIDYS